MQNIYIKVEIFKEGDLYVALCPSLNISSFGESIQEAQSSLLEAVEAFVEECSEMGTIEEVLEESGFKRTDHGWRPRQVITEEHLAVAI